ncbi:MAG: SigE family RNA polymerase sigma factor [Streptosporangiaceae bacterium]
MPETGPASDSFSEFVAEALPGLLRFGHLLTGDPRQAEDLVQEALARTLRRWRSVRRENAGAYVRKVMVNVNINRWQRWEARVQLGDVPEVIAGDLGMQRSDDWDMLRRALSLLPARQRTVLVLRYFEDMPEASIAELMQCRPGTVKSLAARGLAALRPLLDLEAVAGGRADGR